MWHVSVIFVHMITRLYPTPVLWCGVISKTLKNRPTGLFAVSVPVWAHANAYNSILVWALPIRFMWQVSVIFVPAMTALHPIPMLWCGVSGETVKKVTFFSTFCTKRFVRGQLSTRWCVVNLTTRARIFIQTRGENFFPMFLISLRYTELCTKVWAF